MLVFYLFPFFKFSSAEGLCAITRKRGWCTFLELESENISWCDWMRLYSLLLHWLILQCCKGRCRCLMIPVCVWASLGFKTLLADSTSAMHEDYFHALLQNTTTAIHVLRHVTVSFRWYISVFTIFKLNFDRNAVKIWF